MIRILHLTDFHLNKKTLRDWNDFYKEAFLNKISEINHFKAIDLIAFTGDLLDKSGIDFSDKNKSSSGLTRGLEVFKQEIISPILTELNLDISRFIICPGNHDISRNADSRITELGLRSALNSSDEVVNFQKETERNKSHEGINRIHEYKQFEKELYRHSTFEMDISIFKFSLKFPLNGKTIGVSSINSSWRCYDDEDKGRILIGESQLNDNFKFIKGCDLKIALMHHQLDWLSEVERKTINAHVHKKFDIVLSGHVHEHLSQLSSGVTGSCFFNVSPSGLNQIRTDSKTYSNGFTVIDYGNNIDCHFLKYNHEQECFVDNTDIVTTGKISYTKSLAISEEDNALYQTALSNIQEDHFSEMNEHFIKGKNEENPATVKGSYIFPPIDMGDRPYEEEIERTSFNNILTSNDNLLFLGPQEIGKTSLLFRLVVEFVEEFEIYHKIPVYIDFNEVKNKEFITLVKEYTRLNSDQVKALLHKGCILLLIDNINYHESKNYDVQIKRLHAFKKDFRETRIIGSYQHDNLELLPAEIITHGKIPFSYHYIRGLKTKEIKQIMRQWLPSSDIMEEEERLDKLVTTFSSYHLPNNVLSVHLYLWSLENGDKKPINQAVLMEIYVELILEKINKDNIYRKNFDFTNKVQLISMIADKIVRKSEGNNILSFSEFNSTIDDYLKNKVGFSFDTSVIVNYLFDRKIFSKNNSGEVRFSNLCFKHFFVAARMQDNPDFKAYILDESRFFNYPKEIDYYTGLVRSDRGTFKMIYERFKSLFEPMEFILNEVSPDDYFNTPKSGGGKDEEPLARNVEIAKIKNSRPDEATIERQYDEQLDRISNQKQEDKGKHKVSFDRMMLIMCNVLRNSEGLEDLDLKSKAYNDIIKHNLTYSILYSQVVIRYVLEYNKLPPSIPAFVSLEYILKNLPYHVQESLYTHLGTPKLANVILEKIKLDAKGDSFTKTEIEKFLSVALYSDIKGNNFTQFLRKFVKSVNTVPTQNYLLYKITDYLYRRSKDGSENENIYLDLLSDLKIRTQKLPKRLKDGLIKELKEKKSKFIKMLN